jgi:hypothetical protein
MNVMKMKHTSLKKASRSHYLISNHLNGRIKSRKMGSQGVLTKIEDGAIVT